MRKVVLTLKEQKKYDVIKELVDHNGNKKTYSIETRSNRVTNKSLNN